MNILLLAAYDANTIIPYRQNHHERSALSPDEQLVVLSIVTLLTSIIIEVRKSFRRRRNRTRDIEAQAPMDSALPGSIYVDCVLINTQLC